MWFFFSTEEEVQFASDILLEPFQDKYDMLGEIKFYYSQS